ncbi:TolC family protein [Tundrisphaera lichenicola]|uniref:TolC family protein n=1 Tax=Tundrisphaera lichenicola TaxID=2029860 RepID=UPI003EBF00D0
MRFQGPMWAGAGRAARPTTEVGKAGIGLSGRCDRTLRLRPTPLMALNVKDGLAMRLTKLANRYTLAAAVALSGSAGCQKLPHIDQSKAVPHDPMGTIAAEDREVKQANFTGNLATSLPKVARPRTTENPEADEIWHMTLPEAIRIGLDNSEVVRVISLGAQGIPLGGFEPTPYATNAGAGAGAALGAGSLSTVYDPAIQETQIATALSVFDANFTTSILWGNSTTPINNSISAGVVGVGARYPLVFEQDTATFQSTLQKRAATGAVMQIQHNVSYLYSNSPANVFPSAYTTNTQLSITQPLLGGTAQNPSGLEANRASIVIARLNADASVWNFKASIMAHVRSIEQQYWSLSQQQIALWSRETAVRLGEEILRRERAELEVGRATTADVAEAEQQLENFKLNLVTSTSDVVTTERQLRNILGLPPADNRRIVPDTAPTEARLEPDWETSLAQMLAFQPDIVQQQLLVRLTELQLLLARNQLLPQLNLNALYQFNGLGRHLDQAESVAAGGGLDVINPITNLQNRTAGVNTQPQRVTDFNQWQVGLTFSMPIGFRAPLAQTRQAQYQLLRQRAFLQQIVHQSTHALSRFFLEVDSNYKQFRTAQRLRAAAQERLSAQKAFYEEGRITIDRLLDAVSQYANAIAQEAQFKTSYNTSIAALEEAKGTLLAYDNIAVAEGPSPRKAYIQAKDQRPAHGQFHVPLDGSYRPEPINGPTMADPVPDMPPLGEDFGGPKAPFPAPVGPLGPPPSPLAPTAPAGEHGSLSLDRPVPRPDSDPGVTRASAPVFGLVPMPGSSPAPGETVGELAPMTLPPLPPESSLPPLPSDSSLPELPPGG